MTASGVKGKARATGAPKQRTAKGAQKAQKKGAKQPKPKAAPCSTFLGSKRHLVSESRVASLAQRHFPENPALAMAVAKKESHYFADARSKMCASGLMQLTADTASRFGVGNRLDAEENFVGGARYLRYLLSLFEGDKELALAAYNWGEGNVLKNLLRSQWPDETVQFVDLVRAYEKEAAATYFSEKRSQAAPTGDRAEFGHLSSVGEWQKRFPLD